MPNDIEQLIQRRWEEEQGFIVDGVTHDDGGVELFEYEFSPTTNGPIGVRITKRERLERLVSERPNMWTYLTELAQASSPDKRLTALCGEGGMGSDGFVALCRSSDHHLLWLLFSQCSNPFQKITIDRGQIAAVSTHGMLWRIDVNEPSRISITPASDAVGG
jgi:hypothetical protein